MALHASLCPLCGQDNRCAQQASSASGTSAATPLPCWCVAQTFAPALLAQVPAAAQGRACVCAACLAAFASAQHA
ncbi:MAG: hypothetical protein EST26_08315 [Hydrogenophaga sp.]|nr:hypothetical protein [Hydrogenophaga sp.]